MDWGVLCWETLDSGIYVDFNFHIQPICGHCCTPRTPFYGNIISPMASLSMIMHPPKLQHLYLNSKGH